MKFIRTSTKSYLILLILISSFLISIHTETKTARIRSRVLHRSPLQRAHPVGRNSNTKLDEDDSEDMAPKIFDFTLGLLTCLPVIGDIAEKIEEYIENGECDRTEIMNAYKAGIQKRKDTAFAEELDTLDKLDNVKANLPWRASATTGDKIDKLEATNPKKACQAIIAEKERQTKENNKYANIYKGALEAAKEIKETKVSFDQFVKILPRTSFSITHTDKEKKYLNLKHYFKKVIFDHLKLKAIEQLRPLIVSKKISWQETINNAILILSSNEEMAKHNLLQLELTDKEKPDCSKLPTDLVYENKKPTILDKMAGGWAALKYIGKCAVESLPSVGFEYMKQEIEDLMKDIGLEILKRLLSVFGSVVTNILGFFALKAVKVLWWVIKAIYYIYKAINETEKNYKYWGKAVGSGIRIIYIAFMPTERRRMKKHLY